LLQCDVSGGIYTRGAGGGFRVGAAVKFSPGRPTTGAMPTPRSSHAPNLLPTARPGRRLRQGAAALLLGWLLLNWPLQAAATAQRLAAIEAQLRGKPEEAAAALGALGTAADDPVALASAGLALISLGQRDDGMRRVRESLDILQRNGALTTTVQVQHELGSTLERAGFLADAWAAFSEHRRLADSMLQRQHQQAVLKLQESFEHDSRQRAIATLATDTAMGQAKLRGNALAQRLWALAAVAALLLMAVALALLHRMRHSNAALQNSNALLEVASERDPLTGLANRRHLQRVMQQPVHAATLRGSLLLVDIDHFKRINDRHGHAAGDTVLVDIAARLRSVLREEDLTVRWGGEEFLILVHKLPAEQVEGLAERLLQAIGSTPVRLGHISVPVTASIGFATFPLRPDLQPLAWECAVDLVDTAMSLAKAHGRNRAYGVRQLRSDTALAARTQPATLESAWRDGRAELTQHAGPAPAAALQ
jgi:diguanylate cyclase (GGDEF)-like protein